MWRWLWRGHYSHRSRGFVAGEGLVVFGVGVIVDAKASPVSPIAINAADEFGDVLMEGGVGFVLVVVDGGCC